MEEHTTGPIVTGPMHRKIATPTRLVLRVTSCDPELLTAMCELAFLSVTARAVRLKAFAHFGLVQLTLKNMATATSVPVARRTGPLRMLMVSVTIASRIVVMVIWSSGLVAFSVPSVHVPWLVAVRPTSLKRDCSRLKG